MNDQNQVAYRADIDGLRAIAVLCVIAHHLFPESMPNGYLGVDIFFVISGFLIAPIIQNGLSSGRFSLLLFFWKRLRRLMPALIVVLLVTAAFSWLLLLPEALVGFGKSLASAAIYGANIYFWRDIDYFSEDSIYKPLLHLWSLAVEEQFYLLFPLLLMIVQPKKHALFAVCLITLASVLIWLVSMQARPNAAFYALPTRAWEFGAGAILGLVGSTLVLKTQHRFIVGGVGTFTLFLLFLPAPLPDFFGPRSAQVAAVVGAVLLITSGTFAIKGQASLPNKLLASPGMVWVGRRSYSLYLWHWPVLSFHMLLFPLLDEWKSAAIVSIICLALSMATYSFVEQPIRQASPPRYLWRGVVPYGFAMTFFVGLGLFFVSTNGLERRFPAKALTIAKQVGDVSPFRKTCHKGPSEFVSIAASCHLGRTAEIQGTFGNVYVIGDSHGVEIASALSDALPRDKYVVTQVTLSSCAPAVGVKSLATAGCDAAAELVMQELEAKSPATIVLTAYYTNYEQRFGLKVLSEALEKSMNRLIKAGHRVIILGPAPVYPARGNSALPLHLALLEKVSGSAQSFEFLNASDSGGKITAMLQALSKRSGSELYLILPQLCNSTGRCKAMFEGQTILFDKHHISLSAAQIVAVGLADQVMEPKR